MILVLICLPALMLAQNIPFSIVIRPDNFPGDTTWELFFRANGQRIATGTTSAAGNLPPAEYLFRISDSFGDGICCANGQGSYDLRVNNFNFFTSDGQFGAQEDVEFIIGANGGAAVLNGATPSTPNNGGQFQIDLVPAAGFNPAGLGTIITALEAAADRWSEVIVGDLPDIQGVDDLLITYDFSTIDGRGGTIGSAGPTNFRAGSLLPFRGQMTFDSADVGSLSSGELEALFLHEMGHVLGLGTLWRNLGLSQCEQGNPIYQGQFARQAFFASPNANQNSNLLIEQDGGQGTACGHFDEVQLQSEVMTGFLTVNPNTGISEVSTITIGSLRDMGYTVNPNAADNFVIPLTNLNSAVIMDLSHDVDDFEFDESMMEYTDEESDMEMEDLDAMMAGSNTGLYAGVTVGSVAIVGLAGGLIYKRRKQSSGMKHVQLVDTA